MLPAVLAVLAALGAGPVWAEVREGQHQISAGLGGISPFVNRANVDTLLNVDLNENKRADETANKEAIGGLGTSAFLQYVYHHVNYLGVGFELQAGQFSVARHRPIGLVKFGEFKTDGNIVQGLAIARWVIFPSRRVNPYLITGIGFGSAKARVRYTPDAGSSWNSATNEERELYKRRSSGMALTLAPGVQISMGDSFILGAEGRWNYNEVEINVLGTNSLETARAYLWAGFRLGGDDE